jgi:hypothetical protein
MRLWPTAVPRAITLYSLRHGVATNLLRSGADLHTAQRVLGHASSSTTARFYAHLVAEDLRGALDQTFGHLPLPPPIEVETVSQAVGDVEAARRSTRLLPDPRVRAKAADRALRKSAKNLVYSGCAQQDSNLRPSGSKPYSGLLASRPALLGDHNKELVPHVFHGSTAGDARQRQSTSGRAKNGQGRARNGQSPDGGVFDSYPTAKSPQSKATCFQV